MMDESNTYSGCDADVVPNNPNMKLHDGYFVGVGKKGETFISEYKQPATFDVGKLEVRELRDCDAEACYALGVMAGTAARELSDGAMVEFNWALGVVRGALGIERGGAE